MTWNLRDLRRLMAKPGVHIEARIRADWGWDRLSVTTMEWPYRESGGHIYLNGSPIAFKVEEIDRLISKLGPRWPQAPHKRRPKDTEETAPVSEDKDVEDAVHGGDGASGEVPIPNRPAGGASGGPDLGPQRTPQGEPCGRDDHRGQESGAMPGCAPPSAEKGSGEIHAQGEVAHPAGAFSSAEDTSLAKANVPRSAEDKDHISTSSDACDSSGGGDITPERQRSKSLQRIFDEAEGLASTHLGPQHATFRRTVRAIPRRLERALDPDYEGVPLRILLKFAENTAKQSPSLLHTLEEFKEEILPSSPGKPSLSRIPGTWGGNFSGTSYPAEDLRLAQRISQALRRFLQREMGTLGVTSPRVHARRLIQEIISKSMRCSRWRKEELTEEIAILAVDVSGSCSSYSPELTQAAKAVADLDPRLAVVLHSNGIPDAIYGTPTLRWSVPGPREQFADWRPYTSKCKVLIALGDHHAEDVYRSIFEHGARVFWLHNYLASQGAAAPSRSLRGSLEWTPTALVQGVGSPKDVLQAIHMIR